MEENMIAYIGTNAGLVWNALDKLGKMDVKQLKKATKIRTEKDLYAALGCSTAPPAATAAVTASAAWELVCPCAAPLSWPTAV